MCGIAGIVSFIGKKPDISKIKAMTDILAHRGPDGEGIWSDGPVALGHRRLSIIDLSDRAAQPMVSADGQFVICFNGEIYNYKELQKHLIDHGDLCRSASDTEVILLLYIKYGMQAFSLLRGMFAFAIWDNKKQKVFIARDRVGIKPLYFLKKEDAFVFSSEIKAIAASGYSDKKINESALGNFFRFLVISQPDSIFTDVEKLLPGHFLEVGTDGSFRCKKYWDIEEHLSPGSEKSFENMSSDLVKLLTESVEYHMVADVPVSAFLSGGLDSSTVVSLMRVVSPQAHLLTFSTGFPGNNAYDESEFAQRVSEMKHTEHHTSSINENFLNDFVDICWHLDEPFAVSSAYATYYLAEAATQKTKVVLTGDGGDELFAGYTGYLNDRYLQCVPMQGVLKGVFLLLRYGLSLTKTTNHLYLRTLTALRRRIGTEGLRYSEQIAQNSIRAISIAFTPDFLVSSLVAWEKNLTAHYYDLIDDADTLLIKQFSEFKTRLVDEMLMKVDRMTMAHSLEARVPLLDHKVVEFASKIPAAMRVSQLPGDAGRGETKYFLKKTMEQYLPADIIYRKKQGFNIPVHEWLSRGLLEEISEQLCQGALVQNSLVRIEGIHQLKKEHEEGYMNYSNMFFCLLAFEYWYRAYSERIGGVVF